MFRIFATNNVSFPYALCTAASLTVAERVTGSTRSSPTSPTTKNVSSLGDRSQKIHTFWFFGDPPWMHTFTTFCMKWGGTYLYTLCLVSPQGVPRKLLDKKIDKFQTESLSYILSCLVGCLGDQLNTIKYCMILMILQYSILHDLEVPNYLQW